MHQLLTRGRHKDLVSFSKALTACDNKWHHNLAHLFIESNHLLSTYYVQETMLSILCSSFVSDIYKEHSRNVFLVEERKEEGKEGEREQSFIITYSFYKALTLCSHLRTWKTSNWAGRNIPSFIGIYWSRSQTRLYICPNYLLIFALSLQSWIILLPTT